MRPAIGASRSFSLAHQTILPLTKTVVNFKIKLGHCNIESDHLRSKQANTEVKR